MNSIKEQLTNNGIMMSQGEIIATDVMVEHNMLDNEIRYSYELDSGIRFGTITFVPHTTAIYDKHNKITGLLTNRPDPANEWYLFWDNNS